ncbi:C6 transcription factor [Fusarium bulbicola]|nr:C6 transcription factor [Fusarium bulbicola]
MSAPHAGSQSGGSPPASGRKTRTRTTTACTACRARRTRCDSQKPECGYCRIRGLKCQYEQSIPVPSKRFEVELAAIHERLDYIVGKLPLDNTQQDKNVPHGVLVDPNQGYHIFTGEEKLPFQLLGTECVMDILGLGPGFTEEIARLERNVPPVWPGHSSRMHLIQQQHALMALAAFSTHIHIWYPILHPGFSTRYLSIISGALTPGPESCLGLLVAAVGALAQQDFESGGSGSETSSELYLEVAMASLPLVLTDRSIESVQCLFLLAIYHCCVSKPSQAYDYTMMASFKVQNLLKHVGAGADEPYQHAVRAYWAILLLESELRVQLDVVDSGIWNQEDKVPLPNSRRAWQFDIDSGSPDSTNISPAGSIISAAELPHNDRTQAFFLAEISMRRMLHRCNTAIRKDSHGEIIYAPSIALELELQLDEWYEYLPHVVRFQKLQVGDLADNDNLLYAEPLSIFLRVQYYCCQSVIDINGKHPKSATD